MSNLGVTVKGQSLTLEVPPECSQNCKASSLHVPGSVQSYETYMYNIGWLHDLLGDNSQVFGGIG